MNLKVIPTQLRGRQQAIIVDSEHHPISHITDVIFANGWLTHHASALSFNSQLAYARALLLVLKHLYSRQISIVEKVENGEFMTYTQLDKLAYQCSFSADIFSKNNSNSVVHISKKQLLELPHFNHVNFTDKLVSTSTAKIRLKSFRWFVSYLKEIHHASANEESAVIQRYISFDNQIALEIKKLREINRTIVDPFESEIPNNIMTKLQNNLKENSPLNPFVGSKLRNECIFNLFVDTGARNGAIAKLKISDLRDDNQPRIHITRTPNDPDEIRRHKPAQKTKPAVVPISKTTSKLLINYIKNVRSKYKEASLHDFIFISEKGKSAGRPLSLKAYAYLFTVISKHVNISITPHKVRYWFSEDFDKKAEDAGITGESKEDMRKLIMTHSSRSKMGQLYNEKRIHEKAREIKFSTQDKTRQDKTRYQTST
ncbi:site-specific integrase [Vibrio coralliirubri]|uniref:site-specific integrase n=1 Tax=Vibrio coralliirubri TaxID=1516159 RepID=UPI00063770E0|nr:site-specific integrase [Vibrio coralliirubri]CDT98919.1 putative Phage integrase family protein [Vibrio coralliirubri]